MNVEVRIREEIQDVGVMFTDVTTDSAIINQVESVASVSVHHHNLVSIIETIKEELCREKRGQPDSW